MCNRAYQYSNRSNRHHQHPRHWWKEQFKQQFKNALNYPPVNVEELDDRYEVNIYAAGYEKSDFSIGLKGNLLIVSVDKHEKEPTKKKRGQFFQFEPSNFEKRFELNKKINKELIIAEYEAGVLKVTLPKLAEFETMEQEIKVN